MELLIDKENPNADLIRLQNLLYAVHRKDVTFAASSNPDHVSKNDIDFDNIDGNFDSISFILGKITWKHAEWLTTCVNTLFRLKPRCFNGISHPKNAKK
jgi:hypothetical protein